MMYAEEQGMKAAKEDNWPRVVFWAKHWLKLKETTQCKKSVDRNHCIPAGDTAGRRYSVELGRPGWADKEVMGDTALFHRLRR